MSPEAEKPNLRPKILILSSSKVESTKESAFNCVKVGSVFKHPGLSVVCGCSDGVVRIYAMPNLLKTDGDKSLKLISSLETKGGSIQDLAIHDVTRFYANDVVLVDNKGTVTVFCNEQILIRKAVSENCIHCLQIQHDPLGNLAIVASDGNGYITAFSPYMDLWSLRLSDVRQLKALSDTPYVKCLLSANLMDSNGKTSNYIMATDNHRHLFFIHQGSIVLVLNTPAVITAMSCGKFVDEDLLETSENNEDNGTKSSPTQVALGSETGAIYLLSNFEVYQDEIANLQLPLKHLKTLPSSDAKGNDSLLCAGNFNALAVVKDGKEYARHETPSWITSVAMCDVDEDGQFEAVIGCSDNSIHVLKIAVT